MVLIPIYVIDDAMKSLEITIFPKKINIVSDVHNDHALVM